MKFAAFIEDNPDKEMIEAIVPSNKGVGSRFGPEK